MGDAAGGSRCGCGSARGNADEFADTAARHGGDSAGSICSPTNGSGEYLRLPFCLSPDEIRDGVRRLARAWSEYVPERSRVSADSLHVVV
jgi:hypothetical protein